MEETHLLREPISRPGEPTTASPGSARKIRVLMERAARREPLFHPQDGIRHRPAGPPEEAQVLEVPREMAPAEQDANMAG